ncbi:MAG: CinA family nicotinamide mononucleotide deamidase-related protein [Erysipelotrichaceae bacterium]
MKAEILCIGSELLLGDIVNTNAQYLSKECAQLGVDVYFQSVVGDNPKRVKQALLIALKRNDMVLITGGLGPTKDDLSKEVIAELMETELKKDDFAYDNMKKRVFLFTKKAPSISNEKQALLPVGCIPLYNEHGTAPGFILEKGDKKIIVMPGVPKEMKAMFQKDVIPYLKKFSTSVCLSKTLNIYGIGEAEVNDRVANLLDSKNPSVAPYAKEGGTQLRITALGDNIEKANKYIQPIVEQCRKKLGDYIYSENNESLEEVVLKKLARKHQKLIVIEGATKGQLVSRLARIPLSKQIIAFNRVVLSEEGFRMMHNSDDYYHEAYAKLLAEQFFWQVGGPTIIISLPERIRDNFYHVSVAICVDEGCFYEHSEVYGDENEIAPRICYKALDLLRKHIG